MDQLPAFEATQPVLAQPVDKPQTNELPPFEATQPAPELPAFEDTTDVNEKETGKDRGVLTAALEGAGQGVAGPLAPLAEQRFAKVKPEDIRATEEAHPIAHTLGELAGFGASMVTGTGEAGLIAKAGEGVAQGAKAFGLSSKLTQGAAKLAAEMGLYSASNEATKAILDAPNAPGTIASHIGLSALLGGVTGGAFAGAGSVINKVFDGPVAKEFMDVLSAKRAGIDVVPPTKKTLGYRLAELYNDKMNIGNFSSGLGAEIGHRTIGPGLGGYYIGKEFFGPALAAVIKPIAETFPNLDLRAMNQAISMASAINKGNQTLEKATKSLLLPGGTQIINNLMPDDKDLDKLDKKAQELNGDIQGAQNVTGDVGQLMPNHAMMLGKAVGDTVAYINKQRPLAQPLAPLDTPPPVTPGQNTAFKRTLTIAQQPLAILKHIKDGSITVKDIQDISSMYPEFTKNLQSKVAASIVTHRHNEMPIPYHTRIAMGMFLGSPLDSTMTPESIIAAQPMPKPQPPQPGKPKKNTAKMGDKTVNTYKTADQSAEADRSGRDA